MTYTNGKEIQVEELKPPPPINTEPYRIAHRNNTIIKIVQTLAGVGIFWAMAWCSARIWG